MYPATMERTLPRVLCVDDEPLMLSGLRRALALDFEVFTADSGARALELLDDQAFPVIVVDLFMPEMNGVELLARVQEEWPATVGIMLTGRAEKFRNWSRVGAVEMDSYRVLQKPCAMETLIPLLNDAVKKYNRDHV